MEKKSPVFSFSAKKAKKSMKKNQSKKKPIYYHLYEIIRFGNVSVLNIIGSNLSTFFRHNYVIFAKKTFLDKKSRLFDVSFRPNFIVQY